MIIDTHCHLDDDKYNDDLDEVIKRAEDKGVKACLIPGANIEDLPKAYEIAKKYENIYFAAGVHPYHHDQYNESILEKFLSKEKCIAVGECGLDYYRLPESDEEKAAEKENQKRVFAEHIELAKKFQKPLIAHIREASQDSYDLLIEKEAFKVGGVLHCYNASELLLDLSDKGFYFGIGGVVTFKNAKKLVEVLLKIPLDKIILETDAPYLTPHPHRGERNEPAYTAYVAKRVSEILNIDYEDFLKLALDNSKRLFKEFAKHF